MIDQRDEFGLFSSGFVGEAQVNLDAISKVLKGKVQLVFISPENIGTSYEHKQHTTILLNSVTLQSITRGEFTRLNEYGL